MLSELPMLTGVRLDFATLITLLGFVVALPIDRVEVCFHPGGDGCECRKPAPGMLLKAAHESQIDLSKSFMVGDRWRDIDCGHAAGCKTIFIDRGYDEELREKPDFFAKNLAEAAKIILDQPSST